MHCRPLPVAPGVTAIVCGPRARRHRCKCGAWASRQCDHALTGRKTGKTCDAHICERCATRIGADLDLCPPHAALSRSTAQLGLDPSLFRETP